MSKIIDDALKHFRAKAARYRKLAEQAEKEVARLEKLKAKEQPNTVLQADEAKGLCVINNLVDNAALLEPEQY